MSTPTPTIHSHPDFPNLQVTPPTKKRRRWPWVLVGVGGTFVVLMGGCAALIGGAASQINNDAAEVAEGGVSNGIGSKDATADVGTPTMTPADSLGFSTVQIPVTNNSSGRSNYWIDVVIESADGATQFESTMAIVNDLDPGQSATAETMPINAESIPADAVVRLTTVQRTASH